MPFYNSTSIIFKIGVIYWVLVFVSGMGCNSTSEKQEIKNSDPEIEAINTEIKKNPGNASLYYLRAQKFYKKGSFDNSIIDLQQAISIDSLNPDFYHLLSDVYLDYYNSKEALKTMMKVLAIYPERIPSLLKLAELKFILEDYDNSILTINEIVRLDAQNADAFFMLGMNFRALGDRERAINAFQTAVEMKSSITDAWIILGELYEEKKDPKAIKYYESAIISNPKSMQALHAKAYFLQNHGDITGAQKLYREIITTDKSYEDAYLNSGLLYLETDSIDRAYEQFNILTGIAPANYMGYYLRGVVNEKKGNKKDAIKDYESAHHLNSDDKKVQKALETLKNQSLNN